MFVDRQLLLGVGVGLLLAATLSVAGGGRERPLSRVEVIRRAKALGMTFPGERRLSLGGAPVTKGDGAGDVEPRTPEAPATRKTVPVQGQAGGSTVAVVIPPGATAGEIARMLRAKSLIADEEEFLKIVAARQGESRFVPGAYRFRSDVTVEALLGALFKGPKAE